MFLFCAYAVTVPEGGVEKGQEFEVPSPPDIKADPTKSTPATVTVTAPSTLEAGFTFEAVADGKTFTGELRGSLAICTIPGRRAPMGLRVKKIWLTHFSLFLSFACWYRICPLSDCS